MNSKNTILVSLFGGPGCGKSIVAADVFAKLKWKGILAELAYEFVKTKLWEGHHSIFENQIYILGKQHLITNRLIGKVDVAVTDSPFLLGCIYDINNNLELKNLIITEYKKLNTYNVFLRRNPALFEKEGRNQDLSESIKIDFKIKQLLNENNIPFDEIDTCPENVDVIVQNILQKIKNN